MGRVKYALTQVTALILFGILSIGLKAQQTISADTIPTKNPKFVLIRWQYLSPYVEKSHTYLTRDSEAYFIADLANHTSVKLLSDDYNFDHQDGTDTLSVEEIQLDSITSGVLVRRNYAKNFTYMNTGGGWGMDADRIQIWGFEKKKLLFEVYTYYHYEETTVENIGKENEKDVTDECGCSNNFRILGPGLFIVTEGRKSSRTNTPCPGKECKNKKGKYQFKNGKFMRIKQV